MKQNDNVFVIVFSFLFPLILIGWALRDSFDDLQKKVEVEGLLFNLIFLFAFIMLKYLSLIPILGVVFSFLFSLLLWLYIILIIIVMVIKHNELDRELPFISFYAERLKDR